MAAKLAHVITSCHYRSTRNKEGTHSKGIASEENIPGPHKLNNEMFLSKQRGPYWLLAIQNTQFIKNPDYQVNQTESGHVLEVE